MSGAPVFCFDLDDTLVSELDYVESGLRAAGAELDGASPGEVPAGEWLVALWRRDPAARDSFQRLLTERGLSHAEWLPRLKDAYRRHEPSLQLRAGAAEVLSSLAARGARLALLTDGYLDVQRRKWASLHLPCAFDPVVFTDERGREYWKPHPWGFERVMFAHRAATRFFYVGDNPAKDFIAPNRLGWTTVMVSHRLNLHASMAASGDAAPSIILESLEPIVDLV